jgi:hypothetical protein
MGEYGPRRESCCVARRFAVKEFLCRFQNASWWSARRPLAPPSCRFVRPTPTPTPGCARPWRRNSTSCKLSRLRALRNQVSPPQVRKSQPLRLQHRPPVRRLWTQKPLPRRVRPYARRCWSWSSSPAGGPRRPGSGRLRLWSGLHRPSLNQRCPRPQTSLGQPWRNRHPHLRCSRRPNPCPPSHSQCQMRALPRRAKPCGRR